MPASGVPARVAVPSPLSMKVTPEGSAPVSLSAAGREAGGRDRERARRARRERRVVGAGDRRRLVDRECEALGGVWEPRRWRR